MVVSGVRRRPCSYWAYLRGRRRAPGASRRPQTAIEIANRDTSGRRTPQARHRSPRREPAQRRIARLPRMPLIQDLDFIGIPSQDADRARTYYRDVLGMRPDEHAAYEQWAGSTCFGV